MKWSIANNGASTYTDLRFIHGGDTFFGGIDDSNGHYDSGLDMVYLTNAGVTGIMGLLGTPSSPIDHYYEGGFSGTRSAICSGAHLPDTVNPSYVDAGYAVEWDRATLAPGQTWEIESVEKWTTAGDVQVFAPAGQSGHVGDTFDYSFTLQNLQSSSDTFNLSASSGQGWTVSLPGGSTVTIGAGSSETVLVRVTAASVGTDLTTLTATSQSGPTVTNDDSVTTQASVPTPTLTLDNVTAITRDWGINFDLNHSVTVTNAAAVDVNVTYNVSWITDNNTMGTIAEGEIKWHNQTCSNSIVQQITVKVNANTTTASATNGTGTFNINITRRAITITADPIPPQSVNPNTTFRINGSAEGEYAETFIGFADLIRNGSIIENQTITDGNANFSRTESAEGTFNFSIRFYNTTHYNNATTSNATIPIVDDTPPTPSGSSGGSGTYPPGWHETPTVTATEAPAASTTATVAPPGERVTPRPAKAKPAAAKTATPAAETAKNGAPGFTAVFAIAGLLAVAYAMMRRRE